MIRVPLRLRRSTNRSSVRDRVLLALDRLGEAFPSELARRAHTDLRGVSDAMFGREGHFSFELSLVSTGAAIAVTDELGYRFQITPKGRVHAKDRRMELRRVVREWLDDR